MQVNHGKALGIKLPAVLVVFLLVLTIGFSVPWYHAAWIALVIGIIAYALGDLFILRKFGNIPATMADFGLVFLISWFFLWMLDFDLAVNSNFVMMALYTALATAVFEYLFHKWLLINK
ncbi:DUF2512 family protein [Exiguobacterium profundum]|uniref:DUF2512 family protein n=1 Tax=Exiguobacterium profundum TaxID=307643 RepID=UPI00093CAE87|nr:DUF2512 family protein [Exiguobacterium profundum]